MRSISSWRRGLATLAALACALLPLARAQVPTGAADRALRGHAPDRARVMGIWDGTAVAPSQASHPFELVLAQDGAEVLGFGALSVDPGNPLFGFPAARFRGTVVGSTLFLGMSGVLDNGCSLLQHAATTAYDVVVELDPVHGTLTTQSVQPNLPVGCGQPLTWFQAARADEPFRPGNQDILGTWKGKVFGPPGWVFAPPLSSHPRESFYLDTLGALRGFMELVPGGNWGEMDLVWDPLTQGSTYAYDCVPSYDYVGRIEGNKFSGLVKWAGQPDASFFGVFVHTLQPTFVPPGPFAPPCP